MFPWQPGDRVAVPFASDSDNSLALRVTFRPNTPLRGQQSSIVIKAMNTGTQALRSLEVRESLPGGVTWLSWSAGCPQVHGTASAELAA